MLKLLVKKYERLLKEAEDKARDISLHVTLRCLQHDKADIYRQIVSDLKKLG